MMDISQNDIKVLKESGYTDEQISQALRELEEEELSSVTNRGGYSTQATSMYRASNVNDDVAKTQMLVDDILERMEHQLKQDIVLFDYKTQKKEWAPHPEPEKRTLNDYGVHLIMKHMSMYINRDTLMADLKEEQIGYLALDFGKKLNNLIYTKYEEMGMDTQDKRKEYPALTWNLTMKVFITLTRPKEARERDTYRKMTSINLTQPLMNTPQQQPQQTRVRGLLNPMRYVSGKYY